MSAIVTNGDHLFSVRMRASAVDDADISVERHISGAEKIVGIDAVDETVRQMTRRALDRCENVDRLTITVDRIALSSMSFTPCLPLMLTNAETVQRAEDQARSILEDADISSMAVDAAFAGLRDGFGPDRHALRGAALLDAQTGERLDATGGRGVRASRFDYENGPEIDTELTRHGLTHFRTREALALATKVLWSGVAAEICWSDDPVYEAGYVSTVSRGYVRFRQFKPAGSVGGRVFFVNSGGPPICAIIERLASRALLITGPLVINNPGLH